MRHFTLVFLIALGSCNSKQESGNSIEVALTPKAIPNESVISESSITRISETEIIETFADSLNVAEKGKYKVELIKHRVFDGVYVIVKFYKKGRNTTKDAETWQIQNHYSYETTSLSEFETDISDFNNDGLNDLTFISGTAARGANEVRRLFIFDPQNRELISIVNSQDYPNLLYNKELDCIDAFLVYGGCSTVFLNIEGDRLKEFASVELDEGLTVSTFDKNGKRKIIRTDKKNKASYVRYMNFKPLKVYDNY